MEFEPFEIPETPSMLDFLRDTMGLLPPDVAWTEDTSTQTDTEKNSMLWSYFS